MSRKFRERPNDESVVPIIKHDWESVIEWGFLREIEIEREVTGDFSQVKGNIKKNYIIDFAEIYDTTVNNDWIKSSFHITTVQNTSKLYSISTSKKTRIIMKLLSRGPADTVAWMHYLNAN